MRAPGVSDACDICGSTKDVAEVIHRQMIETTRPYVRTLCGTCSRDVARAYYANGGAPITYGHHADVDVGPSSAVEGSSRDW